MTLRRRHHELSKDTKIIKNQHRDLRQLYAGKLTEVRKLCWKSDTFSTREATFVRRVFSTRYKLIRKLGTLRKKICSATTSNSRFTDNISGLVGILAGKQRKTACTPLLPGAITFSSKLRFIGYH